jgi:hypothetical protein
MFLRNFGIYLQVHAALNPRRTTSILSYSSPGTLERDLQLQSRSIKIVPSICSMTMFGQLLFLTLLVK